MRDCHACWTLREYHQGALVPSRDVRADWLRTICKHSENRVDRTVVQEGALTGRFAKCFVDRDPSATSSGIWSYLPPSKDAFVSTQTITNRLHEVWSYARQSATGILLSAGHRAACLAWCRRYRNWTSEWHRILITVKAFACWLIRSWTSVTATRVTPLASPYLPVSYCPHIEHNGLKRHLVRTAASSYTRYVN